MALGKFKLALKDFEAVKKAKPRDPDAIIAKFNACNKIVTQQAFKRAIAVESLKKNVAETIDLSTMGKSLVIMWGGGGGKWLGGWVGGRRVVCLCLCMYVCI